MLSRKILSLLTALFLLCSLTATAHATLIDNGDGTVTQTRLDGSTLIWLQDANTAKTSGYDVSGHMSWDEANTWIASLNSANYKGYNDWRLPDTSPVNGINYDYTDPSYDGSSDTGFNISAPGTVYAGSTGSEMAYMYYYELGNLGYYDTAGNYPQPGWGLINTDIFTNLQAFFYWSGTDYKSGSYGAWGFRFYEGYQNFDFKENGTFAWAVRGNGILPPPPAAVPEPTSLLLLGSGLVGIVAWRKRQRG